jgi:hypothetical protein
MAGWMAWAGGCASPPGTTVPARAASPASPAPPTQTDEDKRFILAPELERVLKVVSVRLIHPPGTSLKIQVNVKNQTQTSQWFRYRIEWFDHDGAPLPLDDKEFTPWMLMAGEMSSIVATAPAPAAVDFGIAFVPGGKPN